MPITSWALVGRHVRVETFDNTVRIYDLGSTHGTLCRGQALGAAGEIWRAGDEVILAQRVKLVWQAESKPRQQWVTRMAALYHPYDAKAISRTPKEMEKVSI